VARAISLVENEDPLARAVVADLYPHTGRARTLGLTGPPGVGKSSLVSALCGHLRSLGLTVGVVSVDPSSPLTDGALLGDRIRLSEHFLDPGVYIRSMGTRGHLGGVAEATLQAGLIVDASGRDVLVYETVGVGQSEVEIASLADTVALVLMPGSGDSIQALKAGIMEIPDLIVVNKADSPATPALRAELRQVLGLAEAARRPPVLETVAITGAGVPELWTAACAQRDALAADGGLARRRRAQLGAEICSLAVARAGRHLAAAVAGRPELRELLDRVDARTLDPLSAVSEILERVYGLEAPDPPR
jgi:LAO/AO transport system kinase